MTRVQGALAAAVLALGGCDLVYLPVNPVVRFSAFQVPYYRQDEFARRFQAWRAGKVVTWTVSFRATAHSESALVIASQGPSTYGAQMSGSGGRGGTFTPSRTELLALTERLLETRLFDLYDGHYGAYDQGGGLVGPELRVELGGLLKHVSYDQDLAPSLSWEATALRDASEAVMALGLKYLRRAGASPRPSAPPPSPVVMPLGPSPTVSVR
ncbi:MAG: hypothetical protein VKQ33_02815 [Candidatus Sericytochromatia bacterium]|nr:hypothetical protein [Candidatus Sericytochromatia bacterium]